MPTLRIMSIYKQRKQAFAAQLSQARAALEQFGAGLVTRFGQETADAIRHDASWRKDLILGWNEGPRLSQETLLAAELYQTLADKVMAVWRKIRTPDCWFRETPGAVWVLETAGLSWPIVSEKCVGDGQLPLSGVLWLLKALRTSEKPARQCAARGHDSRQLPEKWRRLLHGRRPVQPIRAKAGLEPTDGGTRIWKMWFFSRSGILRARFGTGFATNLIES